MYKEKECVYEVHVSYECVLTLSTKKVKEGKKNITVALISISPLLILLVQTGIKKII
jgi:hypothetical protein